MKMKRPLQLCLLLSPISLGGGTLLPFSFQVATLAMDGISLMASQKSLTDHGISAIAQKDCALWRSITNKSVCQEEGKITETVVAEASAQPSISSPYLSVL